MELEVVAEYLRQGLIMICFYAMIAVCAWFYVGQPELEVMLACPGNVAQALAEESGSEGSSEGEELVARLLRAAL